MNEFDKNIDILCDILSNELEHKNQIYKFLYNEKQTLINSSYNEIDFLNQERIKETVEILKMTSIDNKKEKINSIFDYYEDKINTVISDCKEEINKIKEYQEEYEKLYKEKKKLINNLFHINREAYHSELEKIKKSVIPGAKPIHKVDPNTKEVLETFPSIKDVIVKYKISREVLKKAIQNQTLHNGFYWAYA